MGQGTIFGRGRKDGREGGWSIGESRIADIKKPLEWEFACLEQS
jgi:hypothetical protein